MGPPDDPPTQHQPEREAGGREHQQQDPAKDRLHARTLLPIQPVEVGVSGPPRLGHARAPARYAGGRSVTDWSGRVIGRIRRYRPNVGGRSRVPAGWRRRLRGVQRPRQPVRGQRRLAADGRARDRLHGGRRPGVRAAPVTVAPARGPRRGTIGSHPVRQREDRHVSIERIDPGAAIRPSRRLRRHRLPRRTRGRRRERRCLRADRRDPGRDRRVTWRPPGPTSRSCCRRRSGSWTSGPSTR